MQRLSPDNVNVNPRPDIWYQGIPVVGITLFMTNSSSIVLIVRTNTSPYLHTGAGMRRRCWCPSQFSLLVRITHISLTLYTSKTSSSAMDGWGCKGMYKCICNKYNVTAYARTKLFVRRKIRGCACVYARYPDAVLRFVGSGHSPPREPTKLELSRLSHVRNTVTLRCAWGNPDSYLGWENREGWG